MDLGLQGSIAVVTGSTSGIGFSTASRLASEGCLVYVNGRTLQRVDQARKELSTRHPEAEFIAAPGDLSTASGTAAVIDAAPNVDIVVHSAGGYGSLPFSETEDNEWIRKFETGTTSK